MVGAGRVYRPAALSSDTWFGCHAKEWVLGAWKDPRTLESTMEVIGDLLTFGVLVAVGLVGLAVLARTTH